MTDYITVYMTMPTYRMCLCASIYLLMAVGVERYLAVCSPQWDSPPLQGGTPATQPLHLQHHHHHHIHLSNHTQVHQQPNRSTTYIALALAAAMAVCVPRFLEVEPITHCIQFSFFSSSSSLSF